MGEDIRQAPISLPEQLLGIAGVKYFYGPDALPVTQPTVSKC